MAKRGFRSVMAALLLALTALGVLLLQDRPALAGRDVPTKLDTLTATFPSYRIDDQMSRICIIGSGPGCDEIESVLTKHFLERTEIKVVEPGNLRSALAGKIIEHRTGIDPADAQALSRKFQIDHILLFDVETAPHKAYRFGGRRYAVINFKIVNTLNGEVLFQTSRNFGITYDDPRKYGYSQISESNDNRLIYAAFNTLGHELKYALGEVSLGLSFESGTNTITIVFVGSVADRAGIQKGDVLVGVNDTKISTDRDIGDLLRMGDVKQGGEIVLRVERDRKVLERRVKVPVIPLLSQKKRGQEDEGSADRGSDAPHY